MNQQATPPQVEVFVHNPTVVESDQPVSYNKDEDNEEDHSNEEEIAGDDPLDHISLVLLFDEKVTDQERRVIYFIKDRHGNQWAFEYTKKIDNSDESSSKG